MRQESLTLLVFLLLILLCLLSKWSSPPSHRLLHPSHLGTAQTFLALESHAERWRAYHHFIRPRQSLRVTLAQPIQRTGRQMPKRYRSRTPAMVAGITRHCWSVTECLRFPLPEALL
jgi:hypothetical protein